MIYLDSCIVIYAVEDAGPAGSRVRERLAATNEPVAISPLVVHECLVAPLRHHDDELRDRYDEVFSRVELVPLELPAFVRAAEIRAASGLRTPDALHLAAAQVSRCTELWTNDARLAKVAHGLAIDVVNG